MRPHHKGPVCTAQLKSFSSVSGELKGEERAHWSRDQDPTLRGW